MPRRHGHEGATLRRSGFFIFGVLLLTSAAAAQSLRLDDVFSTATETLQHSSSPASLSEFDADPGKARVLLASIEPLLAKGEYQTCLEHTELLAAWLPRDSEDYANCLWYRARAYEGLKEREKAFTVAQLYLRSFPKGVHRGWFMVLAGDESMRRGNHPDAARIWQTILKEEIVVSPADALGGARALNRAGDARATRQLLARAGIAEQWAEAQHLQRDFLIIESLLIEDDSTVAIPPQRVVATRDEAGYALRRALLLELREMHREAKEEFAFLSQKIDLLSPVDRNMLQRMANRDPESIWPPRAATPAPDQPTKTGP